MILEDHGGASVPFVKLCLEKERFPGHVFGMEKVNSLMNGLVTKGQVQVEVGHGSKKQRGPNRRFILKLR